MERKVKFLKKYKLQVSEKSSSFCCAAREIFISQPHDLASIVPNS